MSKSQDWFVYILECADKTLYTGITNNLDKRLSAHNKGTASRYTGSRRPVNLLYSEKHDDRSSALKREINIKSLSRIDKLELIKKTALL